jgi:DNA polymerase-3 subunit alpha
MLLAVSDEAERGRTSGQHGLFGGEDHVEQAVRYVEIAPWSRAEQMAKERENFGFYFAAHPVEAWRPVAIANGARTHAALTAQGISGGRANAVMAAMVEGANRRRTKRGKDFIMVDFSDQTGQFSASCFEESLVEDFLRWQKGGTCLLLQVELDSPSPDEPPRVTVRGAQPLSDVKSSGRMVLTLTVDRAEVFAELAALLPEGPAGKGEVRATLHAQGQNCELRLGRDFALDGEVAGRIAAIEGVREVQLAAQRGRGSLRLVA